MKPLQVSQLNCKYGAPMGRNNILPLNKQTTGKLQLCKLQLVDYDYDKGGAYWGRSPSHGDMFHAEGLLDNENETTIIFVRALTRQKAKEEIRKILPNVKFYR